MLKKGKVYANLYARILFVFLRIYEFSNIVINGLFNVKLVIVMICCCRARAGTAVRSGAPGLCGESPQARAAAMFLPLAQRLLPVDPGQQAAASSQQLAPPAPLQRITLHQEGKI